MLFPAPLLGDFIVVSINDQEVTIEWVLDFNGVCPVENIVFTLSLPLTDEEVDNRTMLFDQPQPDDTRFTTTFTIQGVQQYVLQVNASNGKHSTTVFYVVDGKSRVLIEASKQIVYMALAIDSMSIKLVN